MPAKIDVLLDIMLMHHFFYEVLNGSQTHNVRLMRASVSLFLRMNLYGFIIFKTHSRFCRRKNMVYPLILIHISE